MKKRNKILLASVSFGMCMAMLGCAGQTSLANNINIKMDKIESTINAIDKIENQTFDLGALFNGIISVGAFNPYYNNNYGNFNPNYNGNMGYYYNGNNYYRNYGYGNRYYGSNIDTYRPIYNIDQTSQVSCEISSDQVNLCNSCKSCQDCNLYCDNLKADIKDNVNHVREIADKIQNGNIELSEEQVESVNELLKNIASTCSKISMSKNELSTILGDYIQSKAGCENCINSTNSKLVRVLGCMDTRNSYLQTILNSLLQIECVTTGNCLENCLYGKCDDCNDSNCKDGNCINNNEENISENNINEEKNNEKNNNENVLDDNQNDANNENIEKINHTDNDKIVEDNFLDNNDENNNLKNKHHFRHHLPEPIPDDMHEKRPIAYNDNAEETNSIFNENDQENNKSLTA